MAEKIFLEDAVTEVQGRLDDGKDKVWDRPELRLYLKDAYDTFCDKGRVLFDMAVIPNVPPIGSYGTDLQKYLAQTVAPGIRIEDNRLNATQDPEIQMGSEAPAGYAGSYDLPVKGGEGDENP